MFMEGRTEEDDDPRRTKWIRLQSSQWIIFCSLEKSISMQQYNKCLMAIAIHTDFHIGLSESVLLAKYSFCFLLSPVRLYSARSSKYILVHLWRNSSLLYQPRRQSCWIWFSSWHLNANMNRSLLQHWLKVSTSLEQYSTLAMRRIIWGMRTFSSTFRIAERKIWWTSS